MELGKLYHGAHGAKADQQNRVLIMSDQARGDANPILLLNDENDVEAGHAASVGPVDQQQSVLLNESGNSARTSRTNGYSRIPGAVLSAIPAANVRNKLTYDS